MDALLLLDGSVAHRLAQDELACLSLQEQDAEHLVVDHSLHDLGNPSQQLIHVENGGRLSAHLVQRSEKSSVEAKLAVDLGVAHRDGHVARKPLQRLTPALAKRRLVSRLHVHDAHQPITVNEGNGEFRPHTSRHGTITHITRNDGNEDRPSAPRGLSDDPIAQPHVYGALRALRGKPLGVRQPQGAVLGGEEDIQDTVAHNPTDDTRNGGEERLGVQDTVDLANEIQQVQTLRGTPTLVDCRTALRPHARKHSMHPHAQPGRRSRSRRGPETPLRCRCKLKSE